MITTITLRNYRGYTDTRIPCDRLTLLAGENASGKTSVLRAVSWVCQGPPYTVPVEQLRRGATELTVVVEGVGPDGRFLLDGTYPQRAGGDHRPSTHRALHPRAQRALVASLRAILAASPNLQILATSHSPYLVDAARPDEVVLLGRNAQGLIAARRLDTFPDERLQQMLSTGELWMSEGEDWIAR